MREDRVLGDRICLLTLGGSHAYGTSVEGSDVDVRGVALDRPEVILGLENFEQFINKETDTTIYSFNKIVKLLMNANPNTLELLGCKPEHYLYVSEEGKALIDNADLFLSKRAAASFGGYANAQLRRLQNALARGTYDVNLKEKHIMDSIDGQMKHFSENYTANHGIKLFMADSDRDDYEKEIFMEVTNFKYPLRDFFAIYSQMNNVVKDYNKLNHRNNKKDSMSMCKHAMHIVRLYEMGIEILNGEGIKTYREHNIDLLMKIRNGYYCEDDNSFTQEFWDLVDELEKEFKLAKENSTLPENPDYNKIQNFVMEINRKSVMYDLSSN